MTKKSLPALAVRGIIPLPQNDFRIEVGRSQSLKAIEEAEKSFEGYIIVLVQKNPFIEEPTKTDIHHVGVLAKVEMKIKLPGGNSKIKFDLIKRVNVTDYFLTEPYFVVEYLELDSIVDNNNVETNILVKNIMEQAKSFNEISLNKVSKLIGNAADFSDAVAGSLNSVDPMDKYKYLTEVNVNSRLKLILGDFKYQEMVADVEQKINEEVKKSIDENQKEYYLREKMRAIQNELGDRAKRDEEIEELRSKILAAEMPADIEEKALKELSRYQSTPSAMAESSVIRNYLDFLVDLPWSKTSEDSDDLKKVSQALDKNHYGLEKVKDRIIEYLAVKIMTKKNPQTILCLVGPPGVGKTSLAVSIAEALDRKFVKQSLGGVKDESEIRGHRRTYVGALPGRILNGMKDAKTMNPVFLLDEIDKMASDYKGDPASAMLEVLDPEQNARFSDHYLEESYDLSQVLFITTANYLENIPAPLRDRMEIVELSSYTEHEKFEIGKRHLLPKQLIAHGIDNTQFTIDDESIYYIVRHYTREAGVRDLNRYLGSLIRKTIKDILITGIKSVHIDEEQLIKYIGKPRYTHNIANQQSQVGVATGLAYTAYGGDTLPVEVTYYPGKGELVLTGKLGDVMKESAQTALSYVKSKSEQYNIAPELFKDNDIHIHVPEGAVPKDGPSAGITMATAILSAMTNKPVRKEVGMTGEITLRGHVLPIGGLKEKSISALRSGLTTILIPLENERDIADIPDEVKKELEIILVSNAAEVFAKALK